MRRYILLVALFIGACSVFAGNRPAFSTAGFYKLDNSGREVYNMNTAWRFLKSDAQEAWKMDYNDAGWEVVSLPHGLEYLPVEASGCVNYQGIAWYRKHFVPAKELNGKRIHLHFEGIMGKSKVWVNGELINEHFGGYLPVVMDITSVLKPGVENVIAVCADNSNDPTYAPGKTQEMLDFVYFGGIYRDCFLIAHNDVYITDPNCEEVTAGGGLFVAYGQVSEKEAGVFLKLHVRNESPKSFRGKVSYVLQDT